MMHNRRSAARAPDLATRGARGEIGQIGRMSRDGASLAAVDRGHRVLFVAPTLKDRTVTASLLSSARLEGVACDSLLQLTREMEQDVGAILLTSEALTQAGINELIAVLRRQPQWSEPPIVILMSGSAHSAQPLLSALNNVTLLERPAPMRSVLSAIQSALRGRERQYQIRDQFDAIRQAEQSARELRERLELAVDASELGTFHYSLPSRAMSWNDRCKSLFWLPLDADVDFDVFESRIHPDDRESTRRAILDCIERGERCDIEFRVLSPRGRDRWIRATGRTYRDASGEPVRFDGTMQDMSLRKGAEEALRMADRRKDEFLAMLAHELRNPLAPIRNAVQILRIRAPQDPQLRSTGDMIGRQVRHLARLVDDLLDVSRVTQGKVLLRREPVELSQVVSDGIELAQPFVEAKGHSLTVDVESARGLMVMGDATRIAQIVGNLLDNAAKYTEEGGRIGVHAMREGDRAVVRVTDNGVGIAGELLPRIFDLFTQAEQSLDRAQGGLGIGLSLVRTMVELHGGTVEAKSAGLGAGSEFIVRLPIADVAAATVKSPERKPAAEAATSARSRRVLIVEDNVDSAESLKTLLELDGHDVRAVHEGASALAMVESFAPDIALLDLGLPLMNGFDLARSLRALPSTRDATLIALTGYGQSEDRKKSKDAGFDHHMVKPVDPVKLAAIVAAAPLMAS